MILKQTTFMYLAKKGTISCGAICSEKNGTILEDVLNM